MKIMISNAQYGILEKDKNGKIWSNVPTIYSIVVESKEDHERIEELIEELL